MLLPTPTSTPRILVAPPGLKKYHRPNSSRDVIIVNDLFGSHTDLTIYKNLLYEVQNSGVPQVKSRGSRIRKRWGTEAEGSDKGKEVEGSDVPEGYSDYPMIS